MVWARWASGVPLLEFEAEEFQQVEVHSILHAGRHEAGLLPAALLPEGFGVGGIAVLCWIGNHQRN